jgi:hypothetical protein
MALGYGLDDWGSRVRGLGIFLFTTASRTAVGPTQPPIQMGTRGSFPGVKRAWREADHSPPSSAEVKERVKLYLHSPIRLLAWCWIRESTRTTLHLTLPVCNFGNETWEDPDTSCPLYVYFMHKTVMCSIWKMTFIYKLRVKGRPRILERLFWGWYGH